MTIVIPTAVFYVLAGYVIVGIIAYIPILMWVHTLISPKPRIADSLKANIRKPYRFLVAFLVYPAMLVMLTRMQMRANARKHAK